MVPEVPAMAVDSARVAGDVYGASVVVTIVLAAAALVALGLRGSAGARMVAWRCTIVTILAVAAGRLLPLQWTAWVLPESLAWPLVALGSAQLLPLADAPVAAAPGTSWWLRVLVVAWGVGAVIVLAPALLGRWRLARARRGALPLDSRAWQRRLDAASARLSVRPGSVQLMHSPAITVPITWGAWRPVILLPSTASHWPAARVRAVLLHELAHVRGRDAAGLLAARVGCALFWFHPGVWWLAARFQEDAEAACDDQVILGGVRRSDYAEWLATSFPSSGADTTPAAALALVRRRGVRRRLAAIVDATRRIEIPGRRAVLVAAAVTGLALVPLSTVRVAPTRDVLTRLMQDVRWKSRAWAVVRLAQRPDSLDVARQAASHDPDPSVRAWARYALTLVAPARPSAPRS